MPQVIGGTFEDIESYEAPTQDLGQQKTELGATSKGQNSQNLQSTGDAFADLLRFSMQPQENSQTISLYPTETIVNESPVTEAETKETKLGFGASSQTELIFNSQPQDLNLETSAEVPLPQTSSEGTKVTTKIREDGYKAIENFSLRTFKETVFAFGAIKDLLMDNIFFKILTPEQKKKKEEEKAKLQKKASNMKQFIQDYKTGLMELFGLKQKQKEQDLNRLNLSGTGTEERNQLLGIKNLSYKDSDGIYHLEEAAKSLWRRQQEELKQKKAEQIAKTQSVDRTQMKFANEMGGSQHVLNTAG